MIRLCVRDILLKPIEASVRFFGLALQFFVNEAFLGVQGSKLAGPVMNNPKGTAEA
jgi:hypothetical protein